jgi:hypothetical protein
MRGSAWAITQRRKQDLRRIPSQCACGGAISIRNVARFESMACRSLPDVARCRVSGCLSDKISLIRVRHEMNGTAAVQTIRLVLADVCKSFAGYSSMVHER